MAILGFRIFLIITSQSYFKSIKLRFCMVEFYLGSDQRIFILNFDDVWKFVLLEDFTPSSMLLVLLIYAFITFQIFNKILMEITRGNDLVVYYSLQSTRDCIKSSQLGSFNWSSFQFLFTLFYTSTSWRPLPSFPKDCDLQVLLGVPSCHRILILPKSMRLIAQQRTSDVIRI